MFLTSSRRYPCARDFAPIFRKRWHPAGTCLKRGKKILEELQPKACELSTILGSEVTKKTSPNPLNRVGSSGRSSSSSCSYMPNFQRQCTTFGHNRFRGKGKGKSVVKGPFIRDMILLTGPDINSVPRQGKRVWLMENGHVISGFQLQRVVRVCGWGLRERSFWRENSRWCRFRDSHARPQYLGETDSCCWSSNGVMVHRIFKEIYITPLEQICHVSSFSRKRSLEWPCTSESKGKRLMWIDMLSTFYQ